MSRPGMLMTDQSGQRSRGRLCNPSAPLATLMLMSIATWNVWGLSLSAGNLKTELIVDQMIDFKVDICALQETKTVVSDEMLVKGYKVILMGSNCRHYGLGFIVSPRLKDY